MLMIAKTAAAPVAIFPLIGLKLDLYCALAVALKCELIFVLLTPKNFCALG